jgi:hypothetical protein
MHVGLLILKGAVLANGENSALNRKDENTEINANR